MDGCWACESLRQGSGHGQLEFVLPIKKASYAWWKSLSEDFAEDLLASFEAGENSVGIIDDHGISALPQWLTHLALRLLFESVQGDNLTLVISELERPSACSRMRIVATICDTLISWISRPIRNALLRPIVIQLPTRRV